MKVLMINTVCGISSTGRICTDLAAALEAQGHEIKIAFGRAEVPGKFQKYAVRIGGYLSVKCHALGTRLFDGSGFGSRKATQRFIEWVKEYDPDVIHLHNIHGNYLNIEILFDYLRTCGKKIFWTLHDCWAFTGHAAYCEAAACERWKDGCFDCPKKKDYPISITDNSRKNWIRKKEIFSGIPNLILITPSKWLADLAGQSFLSQYEVKVINNGVDINVFKPTESDVKRRLKIEDKKIILGVAAFWEERKGLTDFYTLAKKLDDRYRIVLVGLSKKQIDCLPDGITGIERTGSVQALAELYSAADVYFNPTYEDNYPTTNLEAIACGTPVVSYKTGGSGESAEIYGKAINKGDLSELMALLDRPDVFDRKEKDISVTRFVNDYLHLYS